MTDRTCDRRPLVEGLYNALASGDEARIAQALSDDFLGRLTPGLPFGIGGEHRGSQSMVRNGWFTIGAHWKVRAEPARWSGTEDGRLQVEGTYRGAGRVSKRPFEAPFVHLWEFDGEKVSALTQFTDSAAFVAALGDTAPGAGELETINLSITDGLAILCFTRPDVRNAINQKVADDFLAAALRIAGDSSVRAVLLCGDGPDLTVGGDIGCFTAEGRDDLANTLRQMVTPFHLGFEVLADIDAPIVTVAQGSVAGGGIGLVYAADVIIAADDARFVTAFSTLGLSGDGGGTWHLPRRIGPARAAWAYLTGTPITAAQGLEWGLVTEVVPADRAHERGVAITRQLADGPTRAFGQMRRLLRQSWDRSLPEQLHAEIESLARTGATTDARNAVQAFLARRRPTFQGD